MELTIEYDDFSDRWKLVTALLSAHWMSVWYPGGGDWTERYGYSELAYVENYRGRPYIYVSKDHHGNFNSEAHCDDRAGDECSARWSAIVSDVRVMSDRNIGSDDRFTVLGGNLPMGRLIDCIGSTQEYPGMECFWTGFRFAGWQGSGGTIPYKDILEYYFWKEPDCRIC